MPSSFPVPPNSLTPSPASPRRRAGNPQPGRCEAATWERVERPHCLCGGWTGLLLLGGGRGTAPGGPRADMRRETRRTCLFPLSLQGRKSPRAHAACLGCPRCGQGMRLVPITGVAKFSCWMNSSADFTACRGRRAVPMFHDHPPPRGSWLSEESGLAEPLASPGLRSQPIQVKAEPFPPAAFPPHQWLWLFPAPTFPHLSSAETAQGLACSHHAP